MSMYDSFRTSEDLEQDGIWIDFLDDHFRVKVARAGGKNREYAKVLERLTKPYRTQLQRGTIKPDQAEALVREAYARAVIKDWNIVKLKGDKPETDANGEWVWIRGIHGPDGGKLDFSSENVIKVFSDLPELFQYIQGFADNYASFMEEERAEVEGNSSTA